VLACPFGVPKMFSEFELMMKCDMCYDRTSVGKGPMCATVCPSGALKYGTRPEMEESRPRSRPVFQFQFGEQTITTKVAMMVPRDAPTQYVDVTAAMSDDAVGKRIELQVIQPDDPLLAALHVDVEES
jgi:Fe-S-cluster-containing dehydrogenase component